MEEQGQEEVRDELRKSLDQLKSTLVEVRGKLRLAGEDAKDTFAELSREAERVGRDLSAASRHTIADLIRRLRQLSERIGADLKR